MNKKPNLCVFCAADETFGKMNVEHFVPKCLWDTVRPRFTRTLPAHVACNQQYAADSEYFRDVLVMEEAAVVHPEVQKIRAGALQRKFQKRFGSVVTTLKGIKKRPVLTHSGVYVGHFPSFIVDTARIVRVLQNIVKGIYYQAAKHPLSPTTDIRIFNESDIRAPELGDVIGRMPPQWNTFGDDVFGCRYIRDSRHEETIACLMRFYSSKLFFGMTVPRGIESIFEPPSEC